MFSGTQQLVESFFVELSTQLKLRSSFQGVGKVLEKYGEIFTGLTWIPIVGSWVERVRLAAKIIGKAFAAKKESSHVHRNKVKDALSDLNKRIVVVLDDIDRLTTSEIRDVFKLVRLTANFPNIIYVLAFDRDRVEKAFDEPNLPGRHYLEKILVHSIDLPVAPQRLLLRQLSEAIRSVLSDGDELGPFDRNAWQDVYMEIVRPLIKNMRDVRRYATAAHAAVKELGSQVELVDVLALEAVRVFLPDTFLQLRQNVGALTSISDFNFPPESFEHRLKDQINHLTKSAGKHSQLVLSLVKRLFPAAERHIGGAHHGRKSVMQWRERRRVAHVDILRLYLERFVGEDLQSYAEAGRALPYMADREAFETFLRSLGMEQVENVILSLGAYDHKFATDYVVPSTVVILNLLPELPEQERDIFDIDSSRYAIQVVYRLMRLLKDQSAGEKAIREILPQVKQLSSRLELIDLAGLENEAGNTLVSESASRTLRKNWRDEVRLAQTDLLVRDPQLLRVLLQARKDAGSEEPPIQIPNSPCITLALLHSAYTEVLSQDFDSRAVYRSPRLDWDGLVALYGDENILRIQIEALKASQPENSEELLQLADKYLSGWRPGLLDRGDD